MGLLKGETQDDIAIWRVGIEARGGSMIKMMISGIVGRKQ